MISLVVGLICVVPLQPPPAVTPESPSFELHLAEYQPAAGLTAATLDSGQKVYVGRTIATSRDVVNARVEPDGDRFSIMMEFSTTASVNLLAATIDHVGRPLAFVVAGEVLSAPIVHTPVANRVKIDGTFTREEADGIVRELVRKKPDR